METKQNRGHGEVEALPQWLEPDYAVTAEVPVLIDITMVDCVKAPSKVSAPVRPKV